VPPIKEITMFRTFTAAADLALIATAAQAGDVTVNLEGLDLSSPANSPVLAQRIQLVAEQACGPAAEPLDNRPSVSTEADLDRRACVRRASQTALAAIQAQPGLARAAAVMKPASN
jgi:UrcA family protein